MPTRNMNEQQLEEYWNNKHPKTDIVYGGRIAPNHQEKLLLDVRKFIWVDDCILKKFVIAQKIDNLTNDEKALFWQKYVVQNYKYISDEEDFRYNEYWQFVFESFYYRHGDCEDMAILTTSLMIGSGIPQFRVRCNAGYVLDQNGQQQGHCYTSYCRETDNNFVILDWCFLEDSNILISEKKLAKNNDRYKDLWFSFNNLYSWSYKSYDIFEDINDEPKTLFNGI